MQEETSSNYSQKKQKSPWAENKIGNFWIKERDGDSPYLLGFLMIDGKRHNVSIYKNKFKSEDKPSNEADFVAFKNFSKSLLVSKTLVNLLKSIPFK